MSEILKKIRIEKGYTQEYMAEKLGYKDKSGYNHLENGNVKLSVDRAIKISKILNVDPSIFFTKEVQETSTNNRIV
ncbi:helix-turn-helix domain-containing protein [Sporanaerobacter acetigenes]|uniref:DNA-binding transcriptional regulator, XRE-family HTH domain n=1 Tax=Sporanaerobacter acetigenes DSM 13106 TaxID=1123281 RepID=A0A1M5U436_9FIRM|nr:helix-turn-helix transcriptional regulator [Sporanaerobacter acetigenes]SHH57782.1 DNA-binding transcriptional regulator, XRE-family HTH domain [Sporanaerobacter acetigenes DSM 13106]